VKRFKLSGAAIVVASIVAAMLAAAVYASTGVPGELSFVSCLSEGGANGCANARSLDAPSRVVFGHSGAEVFAVSPTDNALAFFLRNVGTGALTQASGAQGCLSESGVSCGTAHGMHGPTDVVGLGDFNIYWTSATDSAVGVALRTNYPAYVWQQPAGTDGCVSETGADGCATGRGLTGAQSIASNGTTVYVGAQNSIAVFKRAGSSGKLTQLDGTKGCINNDGSEGCTASYLPDTVQDMLVSFDGHFLYVVASGSGNGAILQYTIDPTDGSLTFTSCVNSDGSNGCTMGNSVAGPTSLTQRDPHFLTVAAHVSNAIDMFKVNYPGNGALTQFAGTHGCYNSTGGSCTQVYGVDGIQTVNMYKTNRFFQATSTDRVLAFARDKKTGYLSALPGTSKCISATGDGGQCKIAANLAGASDVFSTGGGKQLYVSSPSANAVALLRMH
jgi:hypothetical protein